MKDNLRQKILKAIESGLDEHQDALHLGVDESIANQIMQLISDHDKYVIGEEKNLDSAAAVARYNLIEQQLRRAGL